MHTAQLCIIYQNLKKIKLLKEQRFLIKPICVSYTEFEGKKAEEKK